MMLNKTPCMVVLGAVLLYGCGGGGSSDSTSTSTPNTGEGSPVVLTKYNGTYLSECEAPESALNTSGSSRTSIMFDGDAGEVRIYNYDDSACTTPSAPAEVYSEISVEHPGGTVETSLGMADFVNISPENIQLDGQQPDDSQRAFLASIGAYNTYYDIILLDGSSLYVGQGSSTQDGSTDAKRPTTLKSTPSIRQ